MSRKHYQWLALAVLILAPLLTGLLDDYMPARQGENPIELSAPPPASAADPVAVIRTDLPQAQTTTQQSQAIAADGTSLNPNATLDTGGLAVPGADVITSGGASATQPVGTAAAPALALPEATPSPPPGMTAPFREGPIHH